MASGEWRTIGDQINYLRNFIEYALDDAETREAIEPRICRRALF
jgi:hypothetical protein